MQLNPAEISDLIKAKIDNLSVAQEIRTRGTVISVTMVLFAFMAYQTSCKVRCLHSRTHSVWR